MRQNLADALQAVDWNDNVAKFCKAKSRLDKLASCCFRISIFTHEISFQNYDNPAIPFLQEMKASAFQVPACLSLGLSKPAAGLMRAAVESALYYTYFSNHHQELKTLLSKPDYYLSRRNIMEYHKLHTDNFGKVDNEVHLTSKMEAWYGEVSAIVHGQIPGVWTSKSLRNTATLTIDADPPIKLFQRASEIIQLILLMTIPTDDWEGISPFSRAKLLGELNKQQCDALGLSKV